MIDDVFLARNIVLLPVFVIECTIADVVVIVVVHVPRHFRCGRTLMKHRQRKREKERESERERVKDIIKCLISDALDSTPFRDPPPTLSVPEVTAEPSPIV